MMNRNQLTEEERNLMNCYEGRNDRATARNIARMLPYMTTTELETAASVLSKLEVRKERKTASEVCSPASEKLLERLTTVRGYFLLGFTSQLKYFPV